MLTKDRFIIPMELELPDIPMELELPDIPMEAEASYGGLPNSHSASGEVVSFVTDIPYRLGDLKIGIDAVQDLHGYDHPWVGGAGKNLSPATVSTTSDCMYQVGSNFYNGVGTGGSFSVDGDTVTITRKNSNVAIFLCVGQCKANEEMTLSFDVTEGAVQDIDVRTLPPSDAPNNDYRIYRDTTVVGLSHVERTFTAEQDGYVYIEFYSTKLTILTAKYSNIQLEKGSTATDYAPYSNICPISGWTGAKVSVNGVNQWDEQWEQGTFNNDTGMPVASTANIRSKNFIPVLPNTQYYSRTGDNSWLTRLFYDSAQNYITYQSTKNGVFTTPNNACYMKFRTEGGRYGNTYHNDISINYPATETDYHAYIGTTYSVTWQTEAGTIYGGTLDVTTGELVVTHGILDLGTPTYAKSSNNYQFRGSVYNIKPSPSLSVATTAICSAYRAIPWSGTAVDGDFAIYDRGSVTVSFRNSQIATADDFKTSMSGQTLVFELATPQTYQLTPTEVMALLGQNNVWADCGDIENLVYFTIDEIEEE